MGVAVNFAPAKSFSTSSRAAFGLRSRRPRRSVQAPACFGLEALELEPYGVGSGGLRAERTAGSHRFNEAIDLRPEPSGLLLERRAPGGVGLRPVVQAAAHAPDEVSGQLFGEDVRTDPVQERAVDVRDRAASGVRAHRFAPAPMVGAQVNLHVVRAEPVVRHRQGSAALGAPSDAREEVTGGRSTLHFTTRDLSKARFHPAPENVIDDAEVWGVDTSDLRLRALRPNLGAALVALLLPTVLDDPDVARTPKHLANRVRRP
jgi:hypothetical protein